MALSINVRLPAIAPCIVGEKATLIVQLPPPAKDVPQLSVSKNCWLTVMPPMESVGAPRLVNVTSWDALVVPVFCAENCKRFVERVAVGTGKRPLPLKETTRLTPLVPLTVTVPEKGPFLGGVKETLNVHASPLAIPENPPAWPSSGHVVVTENSPVTWKLVI